MDRPSPCPLPLLVRGVSFAVAAGELAAIVGPSGSGKSTLLHLMGTLDRPTTGTVRVAGLDVTGLSDREVSALRATSIGFVFQQFFLAEPAWTTSLTRSNTPAQAWPAAASGPPRRWAGSGSATS
jgi:putative ABC transport system ATP-binding protein